MVFPFYPHVSSIHPDASPSISRIFQVKGLRPDSRGAFYPRVFDWRLMIWCAPQPWEGTNLPPIIMEDHGSVKNGMCPTGLNSTYPSNTVHWNHWTMSFRGREWLLEPPLGTPEVVCLFVGDVCQQGVVETPVRCSQDSVREKKNPSQRKDVRRHHPPEIRE